MVGYKEGRTVTRPCVTSFKKFVLTGKYFLQKSIQNRILTLQFASGIDVVVDSIWRVALGVAVEETLRPLSEIKSPRVDMA